MISKEKVLILRKQNKTYQEIGNIFGVSRQRIHQIITDYKSPFNKLSYKMKCFKNPFFWERQKKQNKKDYKKWKEMAIKHYSGNPPKRAKCGFDNINCLEIDHINNNGAQHRREFKGSGVEFYRWVINNNFPKGFQVLCRNCNWLKYLECLKNKGHR